MREMKDSGIETIGLIPKEWKKIKLKFIADFSKGLSITKADLQPEGQAVVSYGQVHSKANTGTKLIDDLIRYVAPEYKELNKSAIAPRNSFIFADTSEDYAGIGNCVFVDSELSVMGGYHTVVAKNVKIDMPKYLAYLFLTDEWRKQLRENSFGIKVFSVTQKILKNSFILFPPISEQEKIAAYLDAKCEKINDVAKKINAQIDTLESYKKSIITEAVTKGLNHDAPMKNSGIEWIEKIPKEWKIIKIKFIADFSKGLSITKADLQSEGQAVVSYGQVHSKLNVGTKLSNELIRYVDPEYKRFNKSAVAPQNSFIFADTSEDYAGIGNCAFVDGGLSVMGGYHTIIVKNVHIDMPKYLAYLFLTDKWRRQLRENSFGIKVFSVTQKNLKESFIIIPPISEQKKIVSYLDAKCEKIDSVIEKKRRQLAVLDAYRRSLIYEYVTGKKEVPDDDESV